jgi:hypothetical protein
MPENAAEQDDKELRRNNFSIFKIIDRRIHNAKRGASWKNDRTGGNRGSRVDFSASSVCSVSKKTSDALTVLIGGESR